MPGLAAINNIIEANKDLIPEKYHLRDGRIGLDICQDTFWNLLLGLLVHGTKTPNLIRVGYEKLAFTVEQQEWQLFQNELGLQNDQEIEAFRQLITTLLRGENLQTESSTLLSHLPDNTLTLITFIGQAALRYLDSHSIRFNESNYPYEEGKLTEYWYDQIHRLTNKQFDEKVQFLQFSQWAYIRLNRQRLYRIFIFAFILPAKKAISIDPINNRLAWWNQVPKESTHLFKQTELANAPIDKTTELSNRISLFRSRFEKKLSSALDEFESLCREMNAQQTAIKTLSDLLDPLLRSEQIQTNIDNDQLEGMTRIFFDKIAEGKWCLEGKIGDIVSEENKDRYLPDPEKMLSSQNEGQLCITRCGLKVNGFLILPPYVMRMNS